MRAGVLARHGLVRQFVLVVWTLLFAAVLTGCGCASDEPADDGPRPIREVPADAVFYLGDHQGSPVVVTNARGEVIREKAYHPYGSTRHERGDSADPFAYVGNEQDRGSGLSDFHARPYREQAGVFLAPDPVAVFQPEKVLEEPQRLSAYGYCAGDAINRSDPSGELWPAVLAGVAVAVGITIAAQYANAPTRTNPQTKHKGPDELALEATATAITIAGVARGAAALAKAGANMAKGAIARAGQRGAQQASAHAAEVAASGTRYGPMNPGPLDDATTAAFRGGSYTESTLAEPATLYRAYGGGAGKLGRYWTRTRPSGPLQAQLDSALAPQWGNTAQQVAQARVPAGTTIYEGAVAPQSTGVGQLLGGGNQVYIPRVDPAWIKP